MVVMAAVHEALRSAERRRRQDVRRLLAGAVLSGEGSPLVCLDTDPVNSSFSAIKALGAKHVSLLVGDRIVIQVMGISRKFAPVRSGVTTFSSTSASVSSPTVDGLWSVVG